MHNEGGRDDTRALTIVVYVGKVCPLQAREQEEEGVRLARLAGQMERQARVRVFLFVFCKKNDRPCTMMVILTTQELILPKREIKDDVSVEG